MNKNFYTFEIEKYGDERGSLISLENPKNIPFEIKRIYYILDVKEEKKRACHAHRDSQRVLIALAGKCCVKVFDGTNEMNVKLDNPQKALYFNKGVWCELSNFAEDTIILALSSHIYYESEYIRNYDDFLKSKKSNCAHKNI